MPPNPHPADASYWVPVILPRLLRTRRWFGAKSRTVSSVRIDDSFVVPLPHRWLSSVLLRYQGRIAETGGPDLADAIERDGYVRFGEPLPSTEQAKEMAGQ